MKKKFFNKAKNVSAKSDFHQHKLGCVVVYKGKIISEGFNHLKTHPLQRKLDIEARNIPYGKNSYTLHAESSALLKIKDMDISWNKVELYIYRQCKDGHHGLARPCPSCTKLIRDLGIRKVHYTSDRNSFITEYFS